MINKHRKLSNYLINKPLQFRLTVKILLLVIPLCFVVGLIVFYTVYPAVSSFVPYALLGSIMMQVYVRLFCSAMILIAIIFVICTVISHKIAGPIYQIEKKLDSLNNGIEVAPIRLRIGDEFHELAEKVNEIIENNNSEI